MGALAIPVPHMRFSLLISICCALVIAACTEPPRETAAPQQAAPASAPKPTPLPWKPAYNGGTRTDAVKNVILRYNELLAFGYEYLDMTPLQEVTNERQAEKAYHHMAAIGEGGVRMLSRLKRIDFTGVSFPSPGKASVRTREVWDFAYHDMKSGAKKEEERGFGYLMTYTLEEEGGRWLITDSVAVGEEKKTRKEGRR